ncbi:hypothetical protein [Desulfosudis oleivorans]|uniref:Uncharacterized protein n=1 Tax=Desulfosudis oleivorans (strain DSM 6200 / JCM 39069 / Hxd3) TaxID=96561 RepID=A8ZZW4_DESOH|nr:hypothetical protein [Desulfosudis oleivorans]ABW67364.1 hypothetical protein Dole_1560 [Desulfosudis oleivorans Hxd3]
MVAENFMGKYLADYTFEDLIGMTRKQLMALFYQLDAPDMGEMRGEYRAMLLDSGYIINRILARLYLHFTWGDWQHKAFEPLGEAHGHGYNTFITDQTILYENYYAAAFMKLVSVFKSFFRTNSPRRLARIMLNRTSMVTSVFDGRPSFQLRYRDYNTFFTSTMTDEVRKVNDRLYLGIGRLTVTFGKYNPMPFVLIGPPGPWTGPDIPWPENTRR